LTYDYEAYSNNLSLKNTSPAFADRTLNDASGFIPLANYTIKTVTASDTKISYSKTTGKIGVATKLGVGIYTLKLEWQYGKTNTTSFFYPGKAASDGYITTTLSINVKPKAIADFDFYANGTNDEDSKDITRTLYLGYSNLTYDFTTSIGNSITTTNNSRSDLVTTT
jgi:hypothetical protein